MGKRDKLVYIVSDINKVLAFEWVSVVLKDAFNLHFLLISNSNTYLQRFLENNAIPVHLIQSSSSLKSWLKVFTCLYRLKPKIVHTHLWRANLFGLTASWILGVPKRIYTRHHATIHHREYRSGLKWDKLCNALATDVVAISENVKKILIEWDKVNPKKIHLIHHGFDFEYFRSISASEVAALRSQLVIPDSRYPVIGVISRYTRWKGVHHVIDAFAKISSEYPGALLVLANAKGDYTKEINLKLSTLPFGSFKEIEFENNLAALYKTFNIFIHVPTDEYAEAFGQTYVEALIAEVPSIFTLSGVACEFIRHRENALVVPFENSIAITESIKLLLNDTELATKLKIKGRESVSVFSLDTYIKQLCKLYGT